MKILFLARSLDFGGAERQLVVLANGLAEKGHDVAIAVFYHGAPLETELSSEVRLIPLHKTGRWDMLAFILRLRKVIKTEAPDILHGYLGTPNMLAGLLRSASPGMKNVWSVRASGKDMSRYDTTMRIAAQTEYTLSRLADSIIANSHAGAENAIRLGMPRDRMVVIPNGIDTERFRPNADLRTRFREEHGIAAHHILVGILARLDVMKDHENFLRAASVCSHLRPTMRFMAIGNGSEGRQNELNAIAHALGIGDKFTLLPATALPEAAFNGMDFHVSSSRFGEGFSNTVAEAMSCGTPCVVTKVGDSARIVGEYGVAVPARDHRALGRAIRQLAGAKHDRSAIRKSIKERFSVDKLVDSTEAQLLKLIS